MPTPPAPPVGVAFLLAQVGAAAAAEFADALSAHGLSPSQAGILRVLRARPGISQQDLARHLGVAPSRVVGFVDELEQRGWVRRARDAADRRANALTLTGTGEQAFATVARIGRAHEKRVTAPLAAGERETLLALLQQLADHLGLTPGVHPGYRRLP